LRKSVLILGISSVVAGCKPGTPPPAGPVGPIPTPATTQDAAGSAAARPTPGTSDPTLPADPVIATVSGVDIRSKELQEPLMRAFGLDVLLYVVQRDLAREECRRAGIVVSPGDIAAEREWTIKEMFAKAEPTEDREKLLERYLAQPKPREEMRTVAEFDIVMETNTYLRKIAEKAFKAKISDEDVRRQFDLTYGSHLKTRHIMVSNMTEAMAAKARLAAGEDFAAVAKQVSRNPQTSREGGALPPFTKADTRFPENFRNVAFALKEGEVSDPVAAQGSYHLIKLDQRVEPKAVKFEDVRESVREDLEAKLIIEGIKEVRARLAAQALAELKMVDPILKEEFNARLQARDQMIRDREKMKQEMVKRRAATATDPSTQPAATQPTTTPSAAPVPPAATPAAVPPPPAVMPAPPPANPPSTNPVAAPPPPPLPANPVAPPPPPAPAPAPPVAAPPPPVAPPPPPAPVPPPPAPAPVAPKAAAEPPATMPVPPAPATQP
jgi:hypothetical protein